jgi:hypothetical protein
MNARFCLSLAASLLLIGCGDKSDKPGSSTSADSSGGGLLTAPVDYLGAAAKAQQSAVKTVDTVSLNQAIQMFGADHGRNPKDLSELVEQKYIPQIPTPPYGTKIVYDADSGKVQVVKQ